MFWVYNTDVVPTGGSETLAPGTRHPLPQVLHALVRPYPQIIAGTPEGWSFDPDTKSFDLEYSTRRAAGGGRLPAGSQTVVYMPPLQYPTGYAVAVSGGHVVSAPRASTLIIASDPGAAAITVHAKPTGS